MVHLPLFSFEVAEGDRIDSFVAPKTSVEAAKAEARQALGEMVKEAAASHGTAHFVVTVRNRQGQIVYRIEGRVTDAS